MNLRMSMLNGGLEGQMGLTSPSQVADIKKKKKDSFNWNSLGSQCLGPIPVEEGYIGTGRCSGAWLDTVRDWGLPVDDEATLHLPDRKPREARGRRGRQTVMSSLTQKGVSPPGRRLQRHHTQKHSFRSCDVCRHL